MKHSRIAVAAGLVTTLVVLGAIFMLRTAFDGRETARHFSGHQSMVAGIAISADGKLVLSGGWDKTVRLWDGDTGRELAKLTGHEDYVYNVSLSPDARYALSGAQDYSARLWDLQSGKELYRLVSAKPNVAACFSADGSKIATAEYELIRIWNAATGKEIERFPGRVYNSGTIRFSNDGKWLLTTDPDAKCIRLFDVADGMIVRTFLGHTLLVWGADIARDGSFIVSCGDDGLRFWDVASGMETKRLAHLGTMIFDVVLSTDMHFVVTGNADHTVHLLEVSSGRELRCLRLSQSSDEHVTRVAISQDNRRIVAGSSDGNVYVWDQ